GLQLGAGVGVACVFEAFAVEVAGAIDFAHFFKSLAAVIVSGGVVGVVGEESFELADGLVACAGLDVFHRQTVADKGTLGVERQELLQLDDTWVFQSVRIQLSSESLEKQCPAPFSFPQASWIRVPGSFRRGGRWVRLMTVPATLVPRKF